MNAIVRLAALLLLAGAAAAQQDDALSVPLPPGFFGMPDNEHLQFHAVAGSRLVEGLAGDASVLFDVPQTACERVLLHGAIARWAQRAADGTWEWQSEGWVVAGKLPETHKGAYVDVLAAKDNQVEPPLDGLFPTFISSEIEGDTFMIGVPAPGRYEVIVDAARGKSRALATVEAMTESDVDFAALPLVTLRPADFRLKLTLPGRLQTHGAPPVLSLREIYPLTTLDNSATAVRVGQGLTVSVSPRVLGGRLWAWAPGWRVLRVDGREFTEKEPAVARTVEPGRKLLVRVRDAQGEAVERACVELRDAQGQPLVAACNPRGNEAEAQLDTFARVSAAGEITFFGLPAGGVKLSVGSCGTLDGRTVVEWDGKKDEIEVKLK